MLRNLRDNNSGIIGIIILLILLIIAIAVMAMFIQLLVIVLLVASIIVVIYLIIRYAPMPYKLYVPIVLIGIACALAGLYYIGFLPFFEVVV